MAAVKEVAYFFIPSAHWEKKVTFYVSQATFIGATEAVIIEEFSLVRTLSLA